MKRSQWKALGILALAMPVGLVMAWFFYFHFIGMAPQSQDPDYYCVYWLERTLYYGSDCAKANLSLDTAVPGLIECREDPYLRFINKRNGTSLLVKNPWDIQQRWLPSGERVFVDYANGYVFWAKDGKVTNFMKLDPELESQLLESPPKSSGVARSPRSGFSQPSNAVVSSNVTPRRGAPGGGWGLVVEGRGGAGERLAGFDGGRGLGCSGRVEPTAEYLRAKGWFREVETFSPSEAAETQWVRLMKQFTNGVPDDVAVESLMYKENMAWIERIRSEGYTVLDVGEGGAKSPSTFYEMEKRVVYGR